MLRARKRILRTLKSWLAVATLLSVPQSAQATLYVIILDKQEIAIASDGSRTIYTGGELLPVSKTTEKVTKLGSKLAFMCSGLVEIETATVDIRPSEIARIVYVKHAAAGASLFSMSELANEFGKTIADQLDELSPEGRSQILALKGKFERQAPQIFECMFAGVDADDALKIETIDVYPLDNHAAVLHFAFHSEEAVGAESPRLILSGQVVALQSGFQDPQSPIALLPAFRAWVGAFRTRRLDSARTAEALLALAIKYPPLGVKQRLGYPIHVYIINPTEGFKRLKTVREGHAASLPD
jgi:hypothetical protein